MEELQSMSEIGDMSSFSKAVVYVTVVSVYIDETTYKLKVFEERYSDYSKQLNVMVEGIKYYGYGLNCSRYSDNEQSSLILLAILFLIVLIPDALE